MAFGGARGADASVAARAARSLLEARGRNEVSWTSHSECSSKVWRDDLCHAVLADITYVYDTVIAGQDRRCRSKSWLALQFTLLSNPAELRVTASEKPRSVLCAAPTFSLASRPWTQGWFDVPLSVLKSTCWCGLREPGGEWEESASALADPTGVSDWRAVFSAAAADGRSASAARFDLETGISASRFSSSSGPERARIRLRPLEAGAVRAVEAAPAEDAGIRGHTGFAKLCHAVPPPQVLSEPTTFQ